MGISRTGKAAFWTVLATIFVVLVTTLYSVTTVSAKRDHDDPTPTPTTTPAETKVVVCHKDGNSGNYSKVDVSIHSVNDANGLNGHGNHDSDIWSTFTYNSISYSGQGDYNSFDFNNCSRLATATPTATPTPTGAPTQSPSATPTPTNFTFPSCVNYLSQIGDKAHYTTGMHQIVGGPLLSGSDDVYTLEGGNYLQCFCPSQGNQGIQTNWLRTVNAIQGWFFENGIQWNLGNYNYAAQNVSFSCDPKETPAPSETPVPTPTNDPNDICPNLPGVQTSLPSKDWYQLDPPSRECREFQYGGPESSHVENPGTPAIEGYGVGGQVLGASTMAETGTFTENLYLVIMVLGATTTFLGFKNFKKI